MIDHETRRLPCGHFSFLTQRGVVVGWVDTVGVALNLARHAVGEPVDGRWERIGMLEASRGQ